MISVNYAMLLSIHKFVTLNNKKSPVFFPVFLFRCAYTGPVKLKKEEVGSPRWLTL
jgi:hypothetical protein